MTQKTWIDGLIGWRSEGSIIETYWFYDPAIDQDKSDAQRYFINLEKDALAMRPNMRPILIRIQLPSPSQLMEIRSRLELSFEAAAAIAFELCVRFPEVGMKLVYGGGSWRLPHGFLMNLISDNDIRGALMLQSIGGWIIDKSILSEQEKKVSLSASTPKTLEEQESMTAQRAATEDSGSKDVQT